MGCFRCPISQMVFSSQLAFRVLTRQGVKVREELVNGISYQALSIKKSTQRSECFPGGDREPPASALIEGPQGEKADSQPQSSCCQGARGRISFFAHKEGPRGKKERFYTACPQLELIDIIHSNRAQRALNLRLRNQCLRQATRRKKTQDS